MVEHVPGTTPDQELQWPRTGRLVVSMVVADRFDKGVPIRAQRSGVVPDVQRHLHADLGRELLDFSAVHVPDDVILLPTAAPRTLAKLGTDAGGGGVEYRPG